MAGAWLRSLTSLMFLISLTAAARTEEEWTNQLIGNPVGPYPIRVHRTARDTHPFDSNRKIRTDDMKEKWDSKYCCGNDTYDPFSEFAKSLKPVKKLCFEELGVKAHDVDQKSNNSKDKLKCVMQCVLRRLNVVDENGKILANQMKTMIRDDLAKHDWQKKISDPIFNTCFRDLKHKKVKIHKKKHGQKKTPNKQSAEYKAICKPDSTTFMNCVFRSMQTMCPGELARNTTRCLAAKEKFNRRARHNVKA